MHNTIVWLALVLVILTAPACTTTPPSASTMAHRSWQCLDATDMVTPGQFLLTPFPLTPLSADSLQSDKDTFGAAAGAIAAYRKQWLTLVAPLSDSKTRDDLRQIPAPRRLNCVKALLKTDYFATTEKQLMQALATTQQLSPVQRQNLEAVMLHHQHMKLLQDAARARDEFQRNPTAARDCLAAARRLRRVRQALVRTHPKYLDALRTDEKAAGDWAAENWAALFADAELVQPLPAVWLLAPDSTRLGQQQGWGKRLIENWRSETSLLLHLSQDPAPAHSSATSQASWIVQTMALPEKPDDITIYINFLALPGRCSLFFNGQHIGDKDSPNAESCRFQLQPIAPQHRDQTIALYFPDGCPNQYPFPIWISSSTLKKD